MDPASQREHSGSRSSHADNTLLEHAALFLERKKKGNREDKEKQN